MGLKTGSTVEHSVNHQEREGELLLDQKKKEGELLTQKKERGGAGVRDYNWKSFKTITRSHFLECKNAFCDARSSSHLLDVVKPEMASKCYKIS